MSGRSVPPPVASEEPRRVLLAASQAPTIRPLDSAPLRHAASAAAASFLTAAGDSFTPNPKTIALLTACMQQYMASLVAAAQTVAMVKERPVGDSVLHVEHVLHVLREAEQHTAWARAEHVRKKADEMKPLYHVELIGRQYRESDKRTAPSDADYARAVEDREAFERRVFGGGFYKDPALIQSAVQGMTGMASGMHMSGGIRTHMGVPSGAGGVSSGGGGGFHPAAQAQYRANAATVNMRSGVGSGGQAGGVLGGHLHGSGGADAPAGLLSSQSSMSLSQRADAAQQYAAASAATAMASTSLSASSMHHAHASGAYAAGGRPAYTMGSSVGGHVAAHGAPARAPGGSGMYGVPARAGVPPGSHMGANQAQLTAQQQVAASTLTAQRAAAAAAPSRVSTQPSGSGSLHPQMRAAHGGGSVGMQPTSASMVAGSRPAASVMHATLPRPAGAPPAPGPMPSAALAGGAPLTHARALPAPRPTAQAHYTSAAPSAGGPASGHAHHPPAPPAPAPPAPAPPALVPPAPAPPAPPRPSAAPPQNQLAALGVLAPANNTISLLPLGDS